jgi:hypothetical protein
MATFFNFFLITLSTFFVYSTQQASWRGMPGHLKQISAKGDELWGVTTSDMAVRWDGTSWVSQNLFARWVAAASDGRTWATGMNFHTTNANTHQLNATKTGWVALPGWHMRLNAISATSAVAASSDVLWKHDGTSWTKMPGSGFEVAIGDSAEMWMIDFNNKLFRWTGSAWTQMTGIAIHIDVQSSDRVVRTDHNYDAYKWDGSTWHPLISFTGVKCVQATIDNIKVYCVDENGRVYYTEV